MEESPLPETSAPTEPQNPNQIASTHQPVGMDGTVLFVLGLCSFALIGCFFMPWAYILFTNLSGYQVQQLPDHVGIMVWFVPIGGACGLAAVMSKRYVVLACLAAGTVPFLLLIYYLSQLGKQLWDVLQSGAYLTLLAAAILLSLPWFLNKGQSQKVGL